MRNLSRGLLVAGLALAGTLAPAAERGYLGTSLARFESAEKGGKEGIYVVGLSEGSGAAEAGVKLDDRIVAIGAVNIVELEDVDRALDGAGPGQPVRVMVQRDRREHTYQVVLRERPQSATLQLAGDARIGYLIREGGAALGVRSQSIDGQLAGYFGVDAGVLVTEVISDGPAWHANLQAGDVIVAIGSASVSGKEGLSAALASRKPGEVVDVEVQRRGERMSLPVTLGPADSEAYSVTIDLDTSGSATLDLKLKPVIEIRTSEEDDPR